MSCHIPVPNPKLPMEPKETMDVSAMFKKMGSKLGWFEYKDLDSALSSLSNSAKKKQPTKSRRKKQGSTEDANDTSKSGSKKVSDETRQRKGKSDVKDNILITCNSPRQEIQCNSNENHHLEYSEELNIPLKRTPASTDLTKETSRKLLSLKKKKGKENIADECVILEHAPTSHQNIKTNSKSDMEHKIDRNKRSSSESPESDSYDFGVPIQESTRIHSRASIAMILDSPDISGRSSGQESFISVKPLNSSQDMSYQQLQIGKAGKKRVSIGYFKTIEYKRKEVTDDNLRHKLQNLDLSSSDDSAVGKDVPDITDLYATALCEPSFVERGSSSESPNGRDTKQSRKSDMFYFDAKSTLMTSSSSDGVEQSPQKKYSQRNTSSEEKSDSEVFSSYEVADMSIQTDIREIEGLDEKSKNILDENKNNSLTNNDSSESSYLELKDTSLQTSLKNKIKTSTSSEHENSSKVDNFVNHNSDSSYVEVQDNSTQAESVGKETNIIETGGSGSRSKTSFSDSESETEEFCVGATLGSQKKLSPSNLENRNSKFISFSSDEDEEILKEVTNKRKNLNIDKSKTCDISCGSDVFVSENSKSAKMSANMISVSSDREIESIPVQEMSDLPSRNEKVNVKINKGANQDKNIKINDIFSSDEEDESFKDATANNSNVNWRNPKKYDSESSDDDQLEAFFQKMKTKVNKSAEEEVNESMDDFIVEDWEVSSEDDGSSDDDAFYITTTNILESRENKRTNYPVDFSSSDTDNEDDELPVMEKPKPKESLRKVNALDKELPLPSASTNENCEVKARKQTSNIPQLTKSLQKRTYSFLKSLSLNVAQDMCDSVAFRYVKNFTKLKEELTEKLFKLYNETVFEHKLPEDLPIIWNKRLLKTAGYCVYKKESKDSTVKMTVRIELSTKVCDTAERTRDTLIHELCHAAVWLVNGVNGGHGPYWKFWARKANMVHPGIPVVKRCHSYSIQTKYIYQCIKCKYQIGRHSKSLDTKRKVCGHCRGEFVLLDKSGKPLHQSVGDDACATPKTPNRFAMFVKENYKEVKSRDKSMKHGDVMNILSKEFAKQKLS